MPYNKKPGAAVRMYNKKGKPAGLMLEGSVAQMESIANYGSPMKQEHPNKKSKDKQQKKSAKDKFQNAYLNKGGDIKKLQEATDRVIDEEGNVRANPGSIREYDATVK